jgi:putative Mn2+ efflux pump MntP
MLHDLASYILIGLSLSMDAFAVSVSSGICVQNLKIWHEIRSSAAFGLAQFVMPVAGWFLGAAFIAWIAPFDHWIAFAMLAFIGGKMLIGAIRSKPGCPEESAGETAPDASAARADDITSLPYLLTVAFATSIDALAVGLSFGVLGHSLWLPAGIIGVVTFVVCLAGFALGKRAGLALGKYAQIAGGLVLIGIGVKILAEHLLTGK